MTAPDRSMPRLVLGDDGSPGADLAWLWVNSQRWPGWELVVLTADPPPYGTPVPAEESEPHTAEGPPSRTTFADPGFGAVRFLTARADPRTALTTCPDVTALVVGAAGDGGLGPWHLGSTTEWLLHGPPAPMVVARAGRPVRKALVCADDVDLIVLGTRGHSGLSRMVLGSTASAVNRRAVASALSARAI